MNIDMNDNLENNVSSDNTASSNKYYATIIYLNPKHPDLWKYLLAKYGITLIKATPITNDKIKLNLMCHNGDSLITFAKDIYDIDFNVQYDELRSKYEKYVDQNLKNIEIS